MERIYMIVAIEFKNGEAHKAHVMNGDNTVKIFSSNDAAERFLTLYANHKDEAARPPKSTIFEIKRGYRVKQ